MKTKNTNRTHIILLILLLSLHFLSNVVFLKGNPFPEGKDSYAHASSFLNFAQIASSGLEHPFYVQEKGLLFSLVFTSFDYPPLFYFVSFLLNLISPLIFMNGAVLSSSLFFMLLLLGIYKIGAKMSKDTGILAAFICSFYPIIHQTSRHFNLELATSAMVALSIWLLVETEYFENNRYSILLGIMLGLGMLTKQTFIVYISVVFIFYVWISFKVKAKNKVNNKLKRNNLLRIIGIAVIISSIFYFNKLVFASVAHRAFFPGAVMGGGILSLKHLLYYPFSLKNTIGLFFILVFLMGILPNKKMDSFYRRLLFLWLIAPVVLLSFFSLKYAEYTIAVIPAMALISSAGILALPKRARRICIGSVCLVSLILYAQTISGNAGSFYARYDNEKNYHVSILQVTDGNINQFNSVPELLKSMQGENVKIGVCYDSIGLFFPTFLVKRIFAVTKMQSAVVDLMFRTTVFFNNLDDFDFFIYVSLSQKHWPSKQSFVEFIEENNEKCNVKVEFTDQFSNDYVFADRKKIVIAQYLVDKLISIKREYDPYCYIKFDDSENFLSEHVYIYKFRNDDD